MHRAIIIKSETKIYYTRTLNIRIYGIYLCALIKPSQKGKAPAIEKLTK